MDFPDSFRIIVKAGQRKNEVLSYDVSRKAYRVNIKERAENNRANNEIIRYFRKLMKKDVRIVRGLKGKEKVLKVKK